MQTAEQVKTTLFTERRKARLIPLSEIRFCDRVYRYPEDFPAEVITTLIELVAHDEISMKELNYLHLVLIELPKTAAEQRKTAYPFSDMQEDNFAEGGLSFAEYVDYQIERMKRLAENGIGEEYSKRIRELLLRFRNL
ncbi:hypothetical protein EP073_05920 [Geovibrio thiophilus]|uniref:Uncharacterized protein n=1 Tax=Geovibrio thiophilus TaxID=139438 RepID=A0A410JXS2_9BACT|nr:hypothetical protein [Geovibrio thiophilus]QAR32960.1 hypothetical protein EP073_05920 [Geovibrio thiophilus]